MRVAYTRLPLERYTPDALQAILKLQAQNAALKEEVLQLRAAVAIYRAIAERSQKRRKHTCDPGVSLPSCA